MFDSGIGASEMIEQIKDEADVALPIPDASYILWLNALEQLLYTEIIQEQGKIELANISGSIINISDLNVPIGENKIRFEDIHAVYADGAQLIKSTPASGVIFPNAYYKIGNNIGLNLKNQPVGIKIIYFVKPELKTSANINTKNVMLPIEFIELAKSKLRGEAYKAANENILAANWLNDYNALLENFRLWINNRSLTLGI